MKTNRTFACFGALASLLLSPLAARAADEGPEPPTLQQALRMKPGQVIVFQPTPIAEGEKVRVTHVNVIFADGSVRFGEQRAAQLVVYAAEADENGNHEILFQDFHLLGNRKSPVLNFNPYSPTPGAAGAPTRNGIIAVLIGLLKTRSGEFVPLSLPRSDSVSALLQPPTGVGLLLPAVQKVREAAAR